MNLHNLSFKHVYIGYVGFMVIAVIIAFSASSSNDNLSTECIDNVVYYDNTSFIVYEYNTNTPVVCR